MSIIKAPFTKEQVDNLNKFQSQTTFHPFTCGGTVECLRTEKDNYGILIAKPEGWVCACGKYTQDWAHEFMTLPGLAEDTKAVIEELKKMKNDNTI